MPSSPQTLPLVQVYDYLYDPTTGQAIPNAPVKVTYRVLQGNVTNPVVMSVPITEILTTDGNGYWTINVVPTTKLNPANSTYVVDDGYRTPYEISVSDVAVPVGGWQSINIVVSPAPAVLPQVAQTVGALTVTGLLTASSGLTVSGGETVVGALTVDQLNISTALSRIVPGVTSLSLRNNANNADNLLVSDAGNVTVRGNTTIGTGLTITAGGITVTAGGVAVTGNSTITGTLTVTAGLTVNLGGATVTGNSTVTGTLTVSGLVTAQAALTISSGNLNITTGNIVFAAASAKIVPGATSLLFRNNADSASNLAITDAGVITTRNAVEVAPSAGGALPTRTYGTVPNLLDSQTGTSVASLTLTIPAGVARSLWLEIEARSDQAATQAILVQFNADVGANYDSSSFQDLNATLTAIAPTVAGVSARIGLAVATGATAGAESATSARILNADSTAQRKMWKYEANSWATDAAASALYEAGQGQWRNAAAAISSIKLIPSAGNFSFIRARVYSGP